VEWGRERGGDVWPSRERGGGASALAEAAVGDAEVRMERNRCEETDQSSGRTSRRRQLRWWCCWVPQRLGSITGGLL